MGLYDGILGPGSGTVVMILFTKLLKYNLITASGNTKVILLASTLAASVSYILAGKVIWTVAVPVSVFGMLGGYVGAGMAIKKGTKFIRPMMLGIAAFLVIKMAVDLAAGGSRDTAAGFSSPVLHIVPKSSILNSNNNARRDCDD